MSNDKRSEELLQELGKLKERIRELEKSERKYRLIGENSPNLIATATVATNPVYTYISPSHKKILGSEPNSIIGKPCLDFLHPDDKNRMAMLLKKYVDAKKNNALAQDMAEIVEYRIRDRFAPGSWRHLESTVNAIDDELLFITRDITERKRAEELLKNAQAVLEKRVAERTADFEKTNRLLKEQIAERARIENELRESEVRYRSTIDAMGDAIHVVDQDLRMVLYNERLVQWLNELKLDITLDDTSVGKKLLELFPFLLPTVCQEYEKVLATGKVLVTEEQTTVGDRKVITETRKIPVIENGTAIRVVTCIRDITARQKSKAALEESEEKYRTLVEQLLTGIVIIQDFKVVFANQAFARISGYAIGELLALAPEQLKSLVLEDDRALVWGRFKERLAGKQVPAHYQVRGYRKDGSVCWLEMYAGLVTYNGKPAIQAAVLDISERKKAEEAVKQSEELYRALVSASPDAVLVTDMQGKIVYASKRAIEMGGFANERDIVGKSAFDFIAPEDRERAETGLQKTLETGIQEKVEYRLLHKDGSIYIAELSTAVIKNVDGMPRAFVGTLRDVTARKQTENALRESETRYKTLTENINVGIYRNTVGPRGKFIEANPAIIKMFNYMSKEEFLAINVSDLYQHPEDRRKFNEKMLAHGFVRDEELQLKRKDGTPFFGSVSAVAVKDDKGVVQYYDGIVEDITDRKRSEEALKISYTKLRKTLNGTVNALASTAEKRDPYTAGHQQRVTQLACAIAAELGFPSERLEGMHVAGAVHDIGKIHVAAEILNKPRSLTEIEMELIRTHSEAGYEILRSIEFPWPVAEIVFQHHERMDGSGYPRGLTGDKILMEARILGVADVVEAMVSHRPYRSALTLDDALQEILRNRGRLFDPEVTDACVRVFDKGFEFA
jgi:PAS domain S-box-containing protein/putative nucleotidyltransferase with HDIG domain